MANNPFSLACELIPPSDVDLLLAQGMVAYNALYRSSGAERSQQRGAAPQEPNRTQGVQTDQGKAGLTKK